MADSREPSDPPPARDPSLDAQASADAPPETASSSAGGEAAPSGDMAPTTDASPSAAAASSSDILSGREAGPDSRAQEGENAVGDFPGPAEADADSSVPPTVASGSMAPPPPDEQRDRRARRWGVAARSITLFALVAVALVALGQFTFQSDWVADYLKKNDLAMPQRMRLIVTLISGAVVGGLASTALLLVARRRLWAWESIERWGWFLSPTLLLPLLPQLLRAAAWKERHDELLTVMLFVILVSQVVIEHALRNMPPVVGALLERLKSRTPRWVSRYGPWTVVVSAALFYAVFFSFYTIRWHYKLRTHNFDVGINDNLLYGGLKGVFMHSTVTFPSDPGRYMGAHAKLGGYLFLPIYALHPRAETLLAIESSLLGLGAIPLFAFARRWVPKWAAVGVAIAYLCYYPMHSANFYEVNHVPIAAFFILGTVWAADARRWGWFVFMFLSALLMREDMPIGLAIIGGFLLLSGHRPVAGLITAAVSIMWFIVLRFGIMDSYAEWWFPNMYKDLWAPGEKGFVSVLKTLVTNPAFVVTTIFQKRQIIYLMHLLVPVAFLPARRWYLWAAMVPGALLTLLATDYKPVTTYTFQYVMHWTPYLFLAVPLALAALYHSRERGPERARAALLTMLLASAVLTFNYGAFPQRAGSLKGGYFTIEFTYSDTERRRHEDVLALRRLVPPDASVVATENVGPHFSSRLKFYALRRGTYKADYLVAQKGKLDLADTRKHFRRAVTSGEYGVVEVRGEIALLKRGYDTSKNARLIREWNP